MRITLVISSLGPGGGAWHNSDSYHNNLFLITRDKVEQQNDRLADAMRSIRETEEIAGEVSHELSRNRKTLENTQGNLSQLSGMVQHANGTVTKMLKRAITNVRKIIR